MFLLLSSLNCLLDDVGDHISRQAPVLCRSVGTGSYFTGVSTCTDIVQKNNNNNNNNEIVIGIWAGMDHCRHRHYRYQSSPGIVAQQ